MIVSYDNDQLAGRVVSPESLGRPFEQLAKEMERLGSDRFLPRASGGYGGILLTSLANPFSLASISNGRVYQQNDAGTVGAGSIELARHVARTAGNVVEVWAAVYSSTASADLITVTFEATQPAGPVQTAQVQFTHTSAVYSARQNFIAGVAVVNTGLMVRLLLDVAGALGGADWVALSAGAVFSQNLVS